MSLRKRSYVYHNFAHLVGAGVPIVRATKAAGAGTRGSVTRAMANMSEDIEKRGLTVAEAMRRRPGVFAPLDVMVVEVADNSGNLPDGFRLLGDWYELMARIRGIIISGMILPIIVLNIAAVVYPIPRFIFTKMTKMQYMWSVFDTLMLFYVPVMVILILLNYSGTRGTVRRIIDAIAIRIPILGIAIRDMALSRYCHAFSMMAKAGMSVVTAAQQSADMCGNMSIGRRLAGGVEAAKLGNPVVEGFKPGLPLEFLEMWRVGEETGDMATVTGRLAKRYEDRMVMMFTEVARWLPRVFYFFVCLLLIKMIFTMAGSYVNILNDAGSIE
jgi:type IV pilus assembly protein PilC